MIRNLINTVLIAVKSFFYKSESPRKNSIHQNKAIGPEKVKEFTNESTSKDKVMFQPNTLATIHSYEPPINGKTNPNHHSNPKHIITIECDDDAVRHIQNLCRFFEINELEALAKGLWLLTIARDVEINNKKLGVISVDKSGLVVDISSVNIV